MQERYSPEQPNAPPRCWIGRLMRMRGLSDADPLPVVDSRLTVGMSKDGLRLYRETLRALGVTALIVEDDKRQLPISLRQRQYDAKQRGRR